MSDCKNQCMNCEMFNTDTCVKRSRKKKDNICPDCSGNLVRASAVTFCSHCGYSFVKH